MKLDVQGRTAYAYTGGKAFDASLPAIVFIHGALHDHGVWGLQARWFANHGRCVLALDLPGHGRSAGPAPGSVEAAADWVVEWLAAAGLQRAVLAGHSLGSLIALEAAARLGSSAAGLAMLATAYPMKVSPALLDMARDRPLDAIDSVNAFSHSTIAAKPSSPGPGTWLHGANRALMRRQQSDYERAGFGNLFHHDFGLCDAYAGAAEAAARLSCPVGLILGARDQMTPPKATAELARLLTPRIVTLPAGHALMSEAPDGVRDALNDFLKTWE